MLTGSKVRSMAAAALVYAASVFGFRQQAGKKKSPLALADKMSPPEHTARDRAYAVQTEGVLNKPTGRVIASDGAQYYVQASGALRRIGLRVKGKANIKQYKRAVSRFQHTYGLPRAQAKQALLQLAQQRHAH